MQIAKRDKIALMAAGIAVALFALFDFAILPAWDSLQETRDNLPVQEKKLEKYREVAATAGERGAEVSAMEARLRDAERGLLASKTAPLASAELQDLVQQLASRESIDVRASQFLPAKPLSLDYTAVPLGLQFQCRLDQVVNFLKDAADSPKGLSVSRLSIQPVGKEKLVNVNVQVFGIIRLESAK